MEGKIMVGVDMKDDLVGEAIAAAIMEVNQGSEIMRLPGLLKIKSPNRMVIDRKTVEKHMKRDWDTEEFNLSIVSYFGDIIEWDDEKIVISWKRLQQGGAS
jgi:phenol hydroxylase P2 protein